MNYQSLIASIQAAIYNNGAELITGNILQGVLLDMVNALDSAGATYGGTITPASAAPADLDQPTVYLALEAGTYTNYLDSGGNPIVTTGPALITYNGGASLVFSKTDLPSGGSGATVITGGPGDSLVITLPKGDEGIKASYRIDMTAAVYGGDEDARYIGSLIIECNELAMQTAHGYYYGDDMAEILSEVAIWKDDPEIYPDEQGFYLLLTMQSDLDDVIFSVSSLDGQTVDADAANEDEKVKVADATITPVGSGGGDGKIGVISQTQTWTQASDGGYDYTIAPASIVRGIIPQANIDLFEAAGAVFNATSGYFELNGLTDISYEEMCIIYSQTFPASSPSRNKSYALSGSGLTARTNIPINRPGGLSSSQVSISFDGLCFLNNKIESCALLTLKAQASLSDTFNGCTYLKRVELLDIASSTNMSRAINNCYSLEYLRLNKLSASVEIKQSPRLSAESVAYLITNAGTATITITLHATAYARATADASVRAALQSKTNVSLASA